MDGVRRIMLASAVTVAVVGGWAGSAAAGPPTLDSMVVRVVNQFGRSQRTATVIACPLIGGQFDCASPETGVQVNRGGVRRLSLDPHKQYQLLAFVANPDPAWACPGLKVGDNELYLAENLVGFAADFPEVASFVIREPSPLDSVVVKITRRLGGPTYDRWTVCLSPPAGRQRVHGRSVRSPDADGVIRMAIDPDLTYDLGTFVANTGWPCPGFVAGDGTTFHFGQSGNFNARQLLAGATLAIPVPEPSDCL